MTAPVDEIDQNVRNLFDELERSAPEPRSSEIEEIYRRRRRFKLGVVGVTASAAAVLGVVLALGASGPNVVTGPVADEGVAPPTVEPESWRDVLVANMTSWTPANTTLSGSFGMTVYPIVWDPGDEERLLDGVIVFDTENYGGNIAGELWQSPDTPGEPGSASPVVDDALTWRANPASAWTGEEVLLVGGSNGPGIDRPAVAYNPESGTWRDLAPPPGATPFSPLASSGAQWMQGQLILPEASLVYDPQVDEWSEIARWPFGPDRRVGVIESVPGGIVAWGGCDGVQCDDANTGLASDGMLYDVASDSWTEMATSPLPPSAHAVAAWAAGELHVVTTLSEQDSAVHAAYNPQSNSWRALPGPPISPRRSSNMILSGGSLVIWGGQDAVGGAGLLADGAFFSLFEETWSRLPDAPFGAAGHSMVDFGGLVYVSGSRGSSPMILSLPDIGSHVYRECAIGRGFDPEGAWVIWADDGRVRRVKTGRDVPSDVHGPCLEEIGGLATGASSYASAVVPNTGDPGSLDG